MNAIFPTPDTADSQRLLSPEELEAALNGVKSPQKALDDAVARGNQVLRVFQQRTKK